MAAGLPAHTTFGSRHAAPVHLQIVEVNAEGLEAEIMNRDRPLVIDFYATWCVGLGMAGRGLPMWLAGRLRSG